MMLLLVTIETMLYLPLVGIVILSLILCPMLAEGKGNALYGLNFFVQNSALMYLIYFITGQNFSYSNFYLLSGMGYLGIITYAMILGHWYLVVPKIERMASNKGAYTVLGYASFKASAFRVWLYDKFRAFCRGFNKCNGVYVQLDYALNATRLGILGYRHYGVLHLAINKNEEHTKCNWRFVCHDLFCFYWRAHRRLLSL